MKKYIRTKAEITEIGTTLSNEELFDYLNQFNNYRDGLIKVADTIEELCDEFVWENRLLGKCNVDFESKTTYVSKCGFVPFADWEYKIYGAIWTEKGLIYVAKMNSKGDLELL